MFGNNNAVDARICAGEAASSRTLVFISYVSQLFVLLLKAKLLPKLLCSFDSDYNFFVSWGVTAGLCVQNNELLPSLYDVPQILVYL